MKWDLAKLMHEALKKNKKIFKKANEEDSADLAKLEEERYSREPNSWKNYLTDFIEYFFTTDGQMPLYSYENKNYSFNSSRHDEVDLFFSLLIENPLIPSLINMGVFSKSENGSYIYLKYPTTIMGGNINLETYKTILNIVDSSSFNNYINLYRKPPIHIKMDAMKSFAKILIDSFITLCQYSFNEFDTYIINKEISYEGKIISNFNSFRMHFLDMINFNINKKDDIINFLIVSNLLFLNEASNLENLINYFNSNLRQFLRDTELFNLNYDMNNEYDYEQQYNPNTIASFLMSFNNKLGSVFINKSKDFIKDHESILDKDLLYIFFEIYTDIKNRIEERREQERYYYEV